jgi:hypothetical protein
MCFRHMAQGDPPSVRRWSDGTGLPVGLSPPDMVCPLPSYRAFTQGQAVHIVKPVACQHVVHDADPDLASVWLRRDDPKPRDHNDRGLHSLPFASFQGEHRPRPIRPEVHTLGIHSAVLLDDCAGFSCRVRTRRRTTAENDHQEKRYCCPHRITICWPRCRSTGTRLPRVATALTGSPEGLPHRNTRFGLRVAASD